MPIRQWEIYDFPVPSAEQPHPCVVVSPDAICQNADYENVNVLMCVSVRAGYQGKAREVRLNGAGGLDGPTVAKCHQILFEPKNTAGRRRGVVTSERRRQIQRAFQQVFGFFAIS